MHQISYRSVAALMPHEGYKPDSPRGSDNDIFKVQMIYFGPLIFTKVNSKKRPVV